MKAILILLAATTIVALTGCETVTNPDGSTSTRFDSKAAIETVNAGFQSYNQYQRASHVIGYDNLGNPVYAQ